MKYFILILLEIITIEIVKRKTTLGKEITLGRRKKKKWIGNLIGYKKITRNRYQNLITYVFLYPNFLNSDKRAEESLKRHLKEQNDE